METDNFNSPRPAWSTRADDGSNSHNTSSYLAPTTATSFDKINHWLHDNGSGLPAFCTTCNGYHSNNQTSTHAHEDRMYGILDEFYEAGILAYPVRRPVRGENNPWCKDSGEERSQPARSKKDGIHKVSASRASSSRQGARGTRWFGSQILDFLAAGSQAGPQFAQDIATSSQPQTLVDAHRSIGEVESSIPVFSPGIAIPMADLSYFDVNTLSPHQLVSSQDSQGLFDYQYSSLPSDANVFSLPDVAASHASPFGRQIQDLNSAVPHLGFSPSNSGNSSSPFEAQPTNELTTFFDQPSDTQVTSVFRWLMSMRILRPTLKGW